MASTVSNCSAELQQPTIDACPNGTILGMLGDHGTCVQLPTFPTVTTSGAPTTRFNGTLTSTDNSMKKLDDKMQFLSGSSVIGN